MKRSNPPEENCSVEDERNVEALHQQACARHLDFYLDPLSGLMVSTRHQHLKRGECCGSGCRHCPYDGIKGHTDVQP